MQQVIIHTRGENGWAQAKMGPINSKSFGKTDREWIDWMVAHDSDVVTIGDTIYQIVTVQNSVS